MAALDFPADFGADTRPAGVATSRKPWAKDPSGVGAGNGTRLDQTFVNRLVGMLRRLCEANGVDWSVANDDRLAAAVAAALATGTAGLAPSASPAFTGVPTAPTAALGTNTAQIATMAALQAALAALVASAPGVLDTLNELAAALGNDANFAATTATALAGKLAKTSNLADVTSPRAAIDNLSVRVSVASTGSVNLETAGGTLVDFTGTATVTAITLAEGHKRTLICASTPTLVHSSSLLLPGAVNLTPAAGDVIVLAGLAGGVVKCIGFFKAAGVPGLGDLISTNNLADVANKRAARDNLSVNGADIASASTIDLESATGDVVDLTGNATITAITLAAGHERAVRCTGTPTFTHGASLVLPNAANIVAAAGDVYRFRGYASGVVRLIGWMRASVPAFNYTPANKAGDTFTDQVIIGPGASNGFLVQTNNVSALYQLDAFGNYSNIAYYDNADTLFLGPSGDNGRTALMTTNPINLFKRHRDLAFDNNALPAELTKTNIANGVTASFVKPSKMRLTTAATAAGDGGYVEFNNVDFTIEAATRLYFTLQLASNNNADLQFGARVPGGGGAEIRWRFAGGASGGSFSCYSTDGAGHTSSVTTSITDATFRRIFSIEWPNGYGASPNGPVKFWAGDANNVLQLQHTVAANDAALPGSATSLVMFVQWRSNTSAAAVTADIDTMYLITEW